MVGHLIDGVPLQFCYETFNAAEVLVRALTDFRFTQDRKRPDDAFEAIMRFHDKLPPGGAS